MISTAILTISDKGSKGEREDITGKNLKELLESLNYSVEYYKIIPDEIEEIKRELIYICDELKLNLILTNGGTGFSNRDVTPEATLSVIEKNAPGIAEAMRYNSLKITPKAMLSRAVAGIRKDTLIINLPGSPKGAIENFKSIMDAIPHGIDILTGNAKECAR
ncbi:MogA/MoaB family molybdenum cofactor biosynthesis protein [Caloramator sp. E03]|uniref:MogA/MoaB family molybdenum cofactor biosynthesis protein n=1 Tax=Caloramator sp. E03 TaxID=2576307 RepID=UPI0011109A92|nr:MogA/MoaB family molybdenum cofactor biosynthesis protein [Caloramator sp. E03]QCX34135.1 MogA/MoaB family molybdenum cofactor biosynthesis protein [Caloramator sp. E03]